MELEQTKLITALLIRVYGKTHTNACEHTNSDFVNSDVPKRCMVKQEMKLIFILSNQDTWDQNTNKTTKILTKFCSIDNI